MVSNFTTSICFQYFNGFINNLILFVGSSCGKNFWVVAAKEEVLSAKSDDWLTFSRACYHLGNRHVKLQVGDRWLRILPDHVLEDMLIKLGMCTQLETAEFVPESGAYTQFSKGHVHAHDH